MIEINEDTKLYGVYPGFLTEKDTKKIKAMSEDRLFQKINVLTVTMKNLQIQYQTLPVYKEEIRNFIEQTEYALDFCIYKTRRFGVDINPPRSGKRIQQNNEYKIWFQTWYEYFSSMSEEEMQKYLSDVKAKKDTSSYRPSVLNNITPKNIR